MNKRFLIRLVFKNLMARKMRTILTVAGVAISVGFISFLISFGFGLQRVSTSEITNLEALQVLDVTVGKSKLVNITEEEIKKFEEIGNVDLVAPHFQVASKLEINSSSIDGITYGKAPESISLEDIKVIYGSSELEEESLLVTTSALKQLGLNDQAGAVGKELKVVLVPKEDILAEDIEKTEIELEFLISGVMENDGSPFIYMNLDNLKKEGFVKYDAAKIKMKTKEDVQAAKQKIESMGFKTSSLKDTLDQINSFFYVFQMILIVLGGIAVIVAAIGMFNTLTINLLEKTREVGFMKVLGTTKKDIYNLFLAESFVIGFSGGFLGVMGAYTIGFSLNLTIASLARSTGNKPVELFYIPILLILSIILAVVFLSLATGWWPSKRASKINPLDALRYE